MLQMLPWGVDEMLMLSKKFKALSDAFPDDWVPSEDEDEDDEDSSSHSGGEVEEDGEDLSAGEAESSGGKGEDQDYGVEAIHNVRVSDKALRQRKGTSSCYSTLLVTVPVLPSTFVRAHGALAAECPAPGV